MRFEIRRSTTGQFWWRAVGDNNEIMAASELMKRRGECEDAIAIVKAEAPSARVVDKTEATMERGRA